MKKFMLFAAMFAAVTINAREISIDLSKATEMAYDGCTATPSFNDGVLTVNYMTPDIWLWAGVEIPLDNVEGVISIDFDLMGDGKEIACIPYLRDSEGARWAKEGGDAAPVLESTEWINFNDAPNMLMWDEAAYKYGERPFIGLGFIANPAEATTGKFSLKNVKLIVEGEGGGAEALTNVAAANKTVKVIRNGQVLFVRGNKTFNALGAEVK